MKDRSIRSDEEQMFRKDSLMLVRTAIMNWLKHRCRNAKIDPEAEFWVEGRYWWFDQGKAVIGQRLTADLAMCTKDARAGRWCQNRPFVGKSTQRWSKLQEKASGKRHDWSGSVVKPRSFTNSGLARRSTGGPQLARVSRMWNSHSWSGESLLEWLSGSTVEYFWLMLRWRLFD